ncbi:hypothetical protein [Actinomadura parmotrematis]|uniref:Serine/threonine protein kinase n=1 Tax=Actinomadura parmotrematis TaxID=2864039 RepID=A0ABS7FST4_9ACTN|nr:hypothetical protein [Actinomadura parmotrematis]MBW8483015.1 hypothetical protein [Actinomadura parmotrematis]
MGAPMRPILAVTFLLAALAACSGEPEPERAASTPPPSPSASASPVPTAPWEAGQCVNLRWDEGDEPATTPAGRAVPCGAPEAAGRIVKLVRGGSDAARTACPAETDGFVRTPADDWACTVNTRDPHPGRPGHGGGVLRVGDCIYAAPPAAGAAGPVERACYDRYGPGKISSFQKSKSRCRDKNGDLADFNSTRRTHPSLPVICHGYGADVREPGPQFENGTCVEKPATTEMPLGTMIFGGLRETGCGEDAWARVVATVDIGRRCPGGADRQVSDSGHYPGLICLRTT